MPRKPRIWYPGAVYHIMSRGNHRHKIFRDDEDRQVYLAMIRQVMDILPFKLISYCLMTNHVHLQLETLETPPGPIMKRIHMKYAIFFNKKYRFVGQLMQGRFRSEIIDTDRYMLEISRYIHLNPVKAKMVDHPDDYPWSSFGEYMERRPYALSTPERILAYFSEPTIVRYRHYVEVAIDGQTESKVPATLLLDGDEEGEEDDDNGS
ncbi:transposase [Heliorestis acidaminivorans]|uniref:transposase n=1 Tax=Heliorestis acidaminivorans TaxID=553427 RepID=UPI001FAA83A2|nr:transposase [Heliorestis acidaminivorans]